MQPHCCNDDPVTQQEMRFYDEQRMGTCMGLARVMQQLGFLTPLGGNTRASQHVVKLGRGSPRKAYRLSFDKQTIVYVLMRCGNVTSPEKLTRDVLDHHMTKMMAVFQNWPVSRRKAKTVGKGIPKAARGSTKAGIKLKLRCGKAEKETYVVKHFLRKHVSWLIVDRQCKGLCNFNWKEVSLEAFGRFFPDQKEHVTGLGAFGIDTAGSLGSVMLQPPLLTTCFLCLLGPIVKNRQDHILWDTGNHATLIELAQDHVKQFGVPPSPVWLFQRFLDAKLTTNGKRRKRRKTKPFFKPIIQAPAAQDAVIPHSLEGAGSNCSKKPA